MSGDREPAATSFGRRLEKWTRDSAVLRVGTELTRGRSASPELKSVRRYQKSTTRPVALPNPAISPHRYDALGERHRRMSRRVAVTLLLVPLLVLLGAVVGPAAVQAAVWTLLIPAIGLLVHHGRALGPLNAERHLTLRGGLADAWSDWVSAREQLEALDNASQARAAMAANEPRMQALVLTLGQAEAQEGHQDTEEHAASREWIYRSAAKASSLATAERELEAATQRHVDAGELRLAPDGDLDALDHALDTARELTRGVDDLPGSD